MSPEQMRGVPEQMQCQGTGSSACECKEIIRDEEAVDHFAGEDVGDHNWLLTAP